MACNCATSEQIDELYRRYGNGRKDAKKIGARQRIKNTVMYTGVVIALIPIVPCLFLYVVYKGFFDDDHKISLTKFFRLDKKKKEVDYAG
jgi:hypothetical protein